MIRHIVALRFRENVPEAEKASIFKRLGDLRDHLNGILDYQVTTNISPEDAVVHGYRDVFWFDFEDTEVRDQYLADPAHQAVGADIVASTDGGVEGVQVIDVEI